MLKMKTKNCFLCENEYIFNCYVFFIPNTFKFLLKRETNKMLGSKGKTKPQRTESF